MLELLVVGASFFGQGNWICSYHYDYPEQNVREAFVNYVQYSKDLSYIASGKIIYSHPGNQEPFAQFSYNDSGRAKILGNQFYLQGHVVDVTKDFDRENHFKDGYTEEILEFLNNPIPIEEKTLTVLSRTTQRMVVKHEKSGTVTECDAATHEVQDI